MANHRSSWCPCVVATLLVLAWSVEACAREDASYHRAVERVLKLLPKRPIRVVIVDADQADAGVRTALQRMDAFITKGGRVVYLMRQGDILQGALKESPLHEHILAAIIWHEMAHIEGADEADAQRREEALLTDYIMREQVDPAEGMRYLAFLRKRRGKDDKLPHGQDDVEETVNGRVLEHPITVIECIKPSRADPGKSGSALPRDRRSKLFESLPRPIILQVSCKQLSRPISGFRHQGLTFRVHECTRAPAPSR